ncbi:MAG: hypothetical protein AB7E04_14405, partial [Desulfobacteraceae bacterium]
MALICEECGKIYHIDKEKLKKQLKGDFAKTKCRICGHIIQISREELEKEDEPAAAEDNFFNDFSADSSDYFGEKDQEESYEENGSEEENVRTEPVKTEISGERRKGFGLRAKMF